MAEHEDEPVTLSAHALAALAEFQAEKQDRKAKFDRLRAEAEEDDVPLSMDAFAEDWNASQFWYSDETARKFAEQLLENATSETSIGVISTPSTFVALRNALRTKPRAERPRLVLLEYDERFRVFPEFVAYDFQSPLSLPAELKGSLDRVICDPPFLSEDCQAKIALTIRWLLKVNSMPPVRVIICTGERMEGLVTKLYQSLGVHTTSFVPEHPTGLSNEFYCFANFECNLWTWRQRAG
ncbi:Protein-lysine N-methyltransferase efm5 [Purpureocillium takamizusanense]|uniref:Protein-lysine N-methyltransferase EFM5 n=1 Tax=Purpureocillium takamizusanense TaxID=2060973 RepID=A0A9Q8QCU1_9HYPO|nr:Protein-lysine N-methyltransferase efm5 [Purpureocillium takamizusanense]UNI17305.1 Protein-lysine N-methyltransferase efm5 [Purpureocillium takamizusanense]